MEVTSDGHYSRIMFNNTISFEYCSIDEEDDMMLYLINKFTKMYSRLK